MEFFSNPVVKLLMSSIGLFVDFYILIFIWNNRKELENMKLFPNKEK